MTHDEFRAMALSLPRAEEGSHFESADFRVRNKIFACLRPADDPRGVKGVLKLSPGDQEMFCQTAPGVFAPIPNAWGVKGWTHVTLDGADAEHVRHAMEIAWKVVAPKQLRLQGETSSTTS